MSLYKTIDKQVEFFPIYYYDNKLYDGRNIYDISNNSFNSMNNKEVDNKGIVLIYDNYIYVVDTKLLKYDMDYKLIKEYDIEEYITKLIPIKNDFIYISTKCEKCNCSSRINMLTRQ